MVYRFIINSHRSRTGPQPIGQVIFGDIDMAINPNDQIKELEERFQHYDIDNHEKDRLIWQYLVNRKNRRDNDPKQKEIDTDWGN